MEVLLVDDSPLMRHCVARTIEMMGLPVRIHEAGNGREAMEQAFAVHPDLIITDLNMPEMGGGELVARIAAEPLLRGTPIVVLSSDHSSRRARELKTFGISAYMTKPVSPEALREQLLRIMPEHLREVL